MLLLEPQTAIVAFCIQGTPLTTGKLMSRLELELNMFQAALGDAEHVYISKDFPNQMGTTVSTSFVRSGVTARDSQASGVNISISVTTTGTHLATARINSVTARLGIMSDSLRSSLSQGCTVSTVSTSPCTVTITINRTPLTVTFPIPVLATSFKTRIARKSHFIEVVAQVMTDPAAYPSATFTSPIVFSPSTESSPPMPVLWAVPHVHLSTLPIIDTSNATKLSWLPVHLTQTLSSRERGYRSDPDTCRTDAEGTRLEFKLSLCNLFMHYSGFDTRRAADGSRPSVDHSKSTFAISCPTKKLLVFVCSLRLDHGNRTVLLDCALLPVTRTVFEELFGARGFAAAMGTRSIVELFVSEEEMRVWMEVLPSWVERCRTWGHRESCEYRRQDGRKGVFGGQVSEVCGCGKGKFPDDWEVDVPMWDVLKEYCVRGAISPLFASALAEDMGYEVGFEGGLGDMEPEQSENGGGEDRKNGTSGCRACGRDKSRDGGELKGCTKCLEVKYCSRTCQRADWKRHKPECVAKDR